MAGDTLAQASVIRFLSSCNDGGGVAYTRCLMYLHRKKSNGFRSGERGGHSTQPPYPMACCWNVSRMYCGHFYDYSSCLSEIIGVTTDFSGHTVRKMLRHFISSA
ncbi:hypothetical protein AVEN_4543-1 [Araneus ventricosus]|uniref:Uncharacterized protein n=1 Tax=Araneus ventricosus TaxID=182803 RepID=A0A4Y2BMK8_ARAVE|nr:hypothetical protein AVEN_4543-1 [Araneus ventricosus]